MLNLTTQKETSWVKRGSGRVSGFKRLLGRLPLALLPGCVYRVATELCLQPCRKEPLLKTNGITFQRSPCQVLESRATFDNFTQFTRADSSTGQGGVWKEPTPLPALISASQHSTRLTKGWHPLDVAPEQGTPCTQLLSRLPSPTMPNRRTELYQLTQFVLCVCVYICLYGCVHMYT